MKATFPLIAAFGVTAMGCGMTAKDEPASAPIIDAYTGFRESAGVDVCVAGARMVSPSRAPSGPMSICVSQSAQAASCELSSQCRGTERCVCGKCVARACRDSTECESLETCQGSRCTKSCSTINDCALDEDCVGGGCAKLCATADDCAFGERCSALDGTCIVKTCSDTVKCPSNDQCQPQEFVADIREPDLLSWRGHKLAFLELRVPDEEGNMTCAVYRATVVNVHHWEIAPLVPVLAPIDGDDRCVGAPSVITDRMTLVMFASSGDGKAIIRADSSDGIAFERQGGTVLVPSQPFDNGWVGSPAAAIFNGKVALLYQADRGNAVGVAQIDAQGSVSVIGALSPQHLQDPVLWRNTDRIGSPFLLVRGDSLLAYLTVHGLEGSDAISASSGVIPADPNNSIGLLGTRNLAKWEAFPTGPVFARRTNLRAYLGEAEPSVLVDDDATYLVYVGSDASGQYVTGLGLAQADH